MERLPMCRICLAGNVRLSIVANRNVHELYEKLTDIPFVTEDSRPILACFFCCAKLKQCYRLLRQCVAAEELFAQMMIEDHETTPLINQELFSGLINSPMVHLSIDDEYQTESTAIKDELPAVCEGVGDGIEPKEEHKSDDLELENSGNSCLLVAAIPPYHSESDLEDDASLMELKQVEDKEVSKKKQRAKETKRASAAEKRKLDTRRTKLENAITTEQMKEEKSDSKVNRIKKHSSKPGTYFKEPYKCDVCQLSFSRKGDLTNHIRTHTGEKPYKCDVCHLSFSLKSHLTRHIRIHTGEKPYKCDVCQRSFSAKYHLTRHIRIHTGEKPYMCDVCQRSFSAKYHLTSHIGIHTGEKPYMCDVCQRRFRSNYHLSTHMRIHTGEKPYMCDECQHSFRAKGQLSRHIRIHNSKKPYYTTTSDFFSAISGLVPY